jgi:glycolate oxidase iron-sulfur subunit
MSGTNLLQQLDYSVLQQCIHCGLCLPSCPTYDATKRETSSPRGRIALMRAVANGELPASSRQFKDEMYFCLGCLACETACPADVNYAAMLEAARAEVGSRKFLNWLLAPARLRALLRIKVPPAILPARLRELYELRPQIGKKFSFDLIREVESPTTTGAEACATKSKPLVAQASPLAAVRRLRVGLLTGCVQDIAYADINRDTVDVLLANGCEVVTPRHQVCCGALSAHNGEPAEHLVRQNEIAFRDVDVIVVNSAGCGAFMKHHHKNVKDICEFLAEIGVRPPSTINHQPFRVTYHDPCHLVHGQKVSRQPRELLRSICDLVELPEATWCCGSAGIYNITQPELSLALLERKMKHIAATGAPIVATGNPGCIGQLRYGAKKFSVPVEVAHPVTLLARAYRGGEGGIRTLDGP